MILKWKEMRKKSKGFTLIELMIVVAIIAILAAIAIPQYRKFQMKSKTSEAKANIGSIMTAEESFAAEWNQYAQCKAAPNGITPSPTKHSWAVTTTGAGFDLIGFRPAGDVYYVYGVTNSIPASVAANGDMTNKASSCSTDAVISGSPPSITAGGVNVTDGSDDIAIIASGDLDGDGDQAGFYRTDEDTRINPDPVDAGANEF